MIWWYPYFRKPLCFLSYMIQPFKVCDGDSGNRLCIYRPGVAVGVTVRPKHDATARKTDLARQCVAHHQKWTGEAPRYQSTGHFTGEQFQFSKCSMAVRPVPMCLILVWGMHPKKEIYSNAFRQHVELF